MELRYCPEISVVIPVFNAEAVISILIEKILDAENELNIDFEIILVDDASSDSTWDIISRMCRKNMKLKGIKLSRNFGQHYAITAGLDASNGNYAVVMDCDLQQDPKYIKDLYDQALLGNEIVLTELVKRKHSFIRDLYSQLFFRLFNYLSGSKLPYHYITTMSILSKRVVKTFLLMKNAHRHYILLLGELGFKWTIIPIDHMPRLAGKSSYSTKKLFQHALDGIIGHSNKLLRISISMGFVFVAMALLWALWLLYVYIIGDPQSGYTSLMVGLLLSTGLILISIGIMGLYIGKIFEQTKGAPLFIIDEKINL